MLGETICKILGFIALVFIGIYFIQIVMNYQVDTIEGFVEKEIQTIKKDVQEYIKGKKGKLKISKNRQHYEDILKHLDTNLGADILSKITEHATAIAKDSSSKKTLKLMEQINTMSNFKDALQKNLHEWLDSQ